MKYVFNRERALRDVRSMFQQTNIARHQGRRRESKYLPERKIPRHDCEHDTERLITNKTPGGVRLGDFIREVPLSILGIVATNPRALFCLLHGSLDGLAHLERHRA